MQEKYKKKKAKKYLQCLTLIRPCARSLTDYYFQKMPAKIHGLRSDTLAILLSLANISSQSRSLVVDGVGGLIAGKKYLLVLVVSFHMTLYVSIASILKSHVLPPKNVESPTVIMS